MSIWECPKCESKGEVSMHLYGQTECKRCGYKKGSSSLYDGIEQERVERMKKLDETLRCIVPW